MRKLKVGIANLLVGIIAGGVLGGAVVYYNFIDKPTASSVKVGEECPNFIAKPYDIKGDTFSVSNDVFTLVNQRDKVCVINFWETWCQACVEELPEFNQIQVEYGDAVEVVAIAGTTSTMQQAADWMTEKGWHAYDPVSDWVDFSLTFAYLPAEECQKLGVTGMLPRTIIVDKSGVVVHEQNGAMTHEQLQNIIVGLL